MLKLIPQEQPPHAAKINPAAKKTQKSLPLPQLKQILDGVGDQHILKSSYVKLVRYLKDAGNGGVHELGDLIHSLQRSVLSLQRKRIRLIQKQQHAKKRKYS